MQTSGLWTHSPSAGMAISFNLLGWIGAWFPLRTYQLGFSEVTSSKPGPTRGELRRFMTRWLQLPITRAVSICHSEMKKWSEKIQKHCSKSKIHKDKNLPPKQLLEYAEFRSTGSILELLVNKHTKQQVFLPDAFNWGQLKINYVFLLRWTCISCSISWKESSAEKMATIPNLDNWTGSLTWTFLATIANLATNQRPTLDELD